MSCEVVTASPLGALTGFRCCVEANRSADCGNRTRGVVVGDGVEGADLRQLRGRFLGGAEVD